FGGDGQDGAVPVGGVADQDVTAGGHAGLNARAAVVTAVAGLYARWRPRHSYPASLLSASKRTPTSAIPAASSATLPPEMSSMKTILCSSRSSAMINAQIGR